MKSYDNVVIGTGMGGGVLGYALAKAGQEVLFCEKGKDLSKDSRLIYQHFAEEIEPLDQDYEWLKQTYSRHGRFFDPVLNKTLFGYEKILPTLGSITGGSTALYGMVLERFFPSDFSSDLWPIKFNDLEKYYQQAEALFHIKGESDPLKQGQNFKYEVPNKIHPVNKSLIEHLKSKKLNPYIIPKAYENVEGCQTCQSYLCSKKCKNDVNKICLEPAINQHNAQLMVNSEVLRMEISDHRITGIIIRKDNQEHLIKGTRFFLAAGALSTPKILLNSKSDKWPNGLGNTSLLVGKYLMRHLIDLYSLSLNKTLGRTKELKEIGFNDFYCFENIKMGNVQSFGTLPPNKAIVYDLHRKLNFNNKTLLANLLLIVNNHIQSQMNSLFNSSTLLASTLEDFPYKENSVNLDSEGNLVIKYKIQASEKYRLKQFRKILLDLFKEFNPKIIKLAHKNEMLAHACGTCRFGNDPQKSVLNKYNQSHDIENLYIVDSSFFPTSGGTNPALTIAANSLRVAEYILKGN